MISALSDTSVINRPAQAPPCIQTITPDLFLHLETSEEVGTRAIVTTCSSQKQTPSLVLTKQDRQPGTGSQ